MNRNSFKLHLVEGPVHMASHYTRGSVTTLHDFGGVLGRPLDFLLGSYKFHGHDSGFVCEVALRISAQYC
jgi:hypothetical protein